MVRERHRPRLCEICEADMAPRDVTCWRCGAVWVTRAATPHDDGSSLRERTAHVLDTRTRRRAARRADIETGGRRAVSMSAGPANGLSAPLAFCIMARDGLANLSGDPLRSVRSSPARRPRPGPQRPQPDQLGKVVDRLHWPATAGTEIAEVIGRVALAPHPGPAGHAPRVGHGRSRFRRTIVRRGRLQRLNGRAVRLMGGVATSRTLPVTRWSGRLPVPVRSSVVR
jgi:hypothetical protein